MTADHSSQLLSLKQEIRARALACRRNQQNQDPLSRQICDKLAGLPEYAAARTVMFYVDAPGEVRTRHFLPIAQHQGKQIVIPYCTCGRIELFRFQDLHELTPSTFGILEPRVELQGRSDRTIDVLQLDLIVVPGVAFDSRGGRLGRGKGYYDGLLKQVRPDTALIALAFDCQIVPEVPMLPHDVYVDKVITERAIYEGPARDRRPASEDKDPSP